MEASQDSAFIRSRGSRLLPAPLENIHKLKVVLIGDINVGKTSLAVRFSQNKFSENHAHTIGGSYVSKNTIINDDVINFELWDTAGQERYRSLIPMYLRNADIAFIVYDVTDPGSFANISVWLDALQHHCDMAKSVLVANKCDMQATVDESLALSFALDNGLQFVTVSAKSGYNVDKLFHSIGSTVIEQRKRLARPVSTMNPPVVLKIQHQDKSKRKKTCC